MHSANILYTRSPSYLVSEASPVYWAGSILLCEKISRSSHLTGLASLHVKWAPSHENRCEEVEALVSFSKRNETRAYDSMIRPMIRN